MQNRWLFPILLAQSRAIISYCDKMLYESLLLGINQYQEPQQSFYQKYYQKLFLGIFMWTYFLTWRCLIFGGGSERRNLSHCRSFILSFNINCPPPLYDNSFPLEEIRFFIVMEYLITSLEVHVGANHNINMEGHIFTKLPIYERIGKSIAVCFENCQYSIY